MAALVAAAAGHSAPAQKFKVKLRCDRDGSGQRGACQGDGEEAADLQQGHPRSPATSEALRCRECGLCKDAGSFSLKQVKAVAKFRARLASQEGASGKGFVDPLCLDCVKQLRCEENKEPVGIPVCEVCGGAQKGLPGRRALDGGSVASTCRGSSVYATDPDSLPQGVRYYPNFLSEEEEQALLDVLDSKTWIKRLRRRQQFYGEVYYHTTREDASMQPVLQGDSSASSSSEASPRDQGPAENAPHDVKDGGLVSHDLQALQFLADKFYQWPFVRSADARQGLPSAEGCCCTTAGGGPCGCQAGGCSLCGSSSSCPIFGASPQEFPSQILVNEYVDNWGIASHFEDFAAFGDTIATVSLGNPVYMTLEQPRERNNQCGEILKDTKVLLERRSLLVLSGEARTAFRHGITQHRNVWTPDQGLLRREGGYRRVSLTIRHLLSGRRQAGQ